jgi:hypothetical protein
MVVLDHAAWVGIKQGVFRHWFFLAVVVAHPVNPGDANQHRLNEIDSRRLLGRVTRV